VKLRFTERANRSKRVCTRGKQIFAQEKENKQGYGTGPCRIPAMVRKLRKVHAYSNFGKKGRHKTTRFS